jgi:regulation of enolase protein 1 (concanavalin A-like superfamily)
MKHIAPLSVLVLLSAACALVFAASDAAYAGTSVQAEGVEASPAAAFVSDDFNACALDETIWTWVDPLGDGTYGLENPFTDTARLTIMAPAGSAHDIWENGNFAPRLMQTITDSDFEVEAKYDSPVSLRYQMQGILVEGDASNFLRIEFYSEGTDSHLLAAVFSPGTTDPLAVDTKADLPVGDSGIAPLYLRVGREVDDWTVSTSLDGVAWNEAITFTHALTVTGVGVYGANAGKDAPAHTAQIDYVFNTAAPIVPEDGARNTLTVTITGEGTVAVDPEKPEYDCGEVVTLTASANEGSAFDGWQGPDSADLQDNGDGTWSLTMDGPKELTAQFSLQTRTLTVDIVGQGEVLQVPEGPYLFGDTVTLTPEPEAGWTFDGWSGPHASDLQDNGDGTWSLIMNEDKQVTATFDLKAGRIAYLPMAAQNELPPPTAVSDDFHACSLNRALWTWVDPVGDSTYTIQGAYTQNARLAISVPAGSAHDIWVDGNLAPRVMQTIKDIDFEIEAKYDSPVRLRYQLQGIVVEEDAENFLRIELYSDGLGTNLLVAVFAPGTANSLIVDLKADLPIAATNVKPLYLRVRRQGDNWTVSYSLDGTAWNEAVAFSHALTVDSVGLYGANAGSPPPAYTAQIDYFFDTLSPILPEDGAQNTLTVDIVGQGTVGVNPTKASYACGEEITLSPNPSPGWVFDGWQGRDRGFVQDNGNGTWSLKMDGPRLVTAVFGAANQ